MYRNFGYASSSKTGCLGSCKQDEETISSWHCEQFSALRATQSKGEQFFAYAAVDKMEWNSSLPLQ